MWHFSCYSNKNSQPNLTQGVGDSCRKFPRGFCCEGHQDYRGAYFCFGRSRTDCSYEAAIQGVRACHCGVWGTWMSRDGSDRIKGERINGL